MCIIETVMIVRENLNTYYSLKKNVLLIIIIVR